MWYLQFLLRSVIGQVNIPTSPWVELYLVLNLQIKTERMHWVMYIKIPFPIYFDSNFPTNNSLWGFQPVELSGPCFTFASEGPTQCISKSTQTSGNLLILAATRSAAACHIRFCDQNQILIACVPTIIYST
jgi:hypothetical protein